MRKFIKIKVNWILVQTDIKLFNHFLNSRIVDLYLKYYIIWILLRGSLSR